MPHLEITTLGAIKASLDGRRLASFRTDKVRALLVFLAVEASHPHRREALAGMFWADRPAAAARNNLRQALYRLRESIHDQGSGCPYLLVTGNEIQFNPGCDYWLDVDQFSAHLAAYQAHHPGGLSMCQGCLEGLCAAVSLYGGDFLAGFSLPDCPQFEWWLLTQQELYHHQVLEALASLGSYYESRADYHQAGSYALKEIELEPWRESAHRRRMHALALSGERNEALRQYESCRAILARELGVEPSPESVRLYERIRDGRLDTAALKASVRVPTSLEALTSSVTGTFVAREAELARLEACLAAALAGQGRVVFVTGEAGSGKTSLIGEFARRALQAQEGLLAAGGSCNAYAGRGNAYLPFVECLRMLSGDVEASQVSCLLSEETLQHQWAAFPAVLQALLAAGPDLVGTLLPGQALLQHARAAAGADDHWVDQLETRLASTPGNQTSEAPGGQPAAGAESGAQAGAGSAPLNQADLFEQVTQVLQTLSRRHPLMLALDDLQWADQASLTLLFHLGRRLTGSRILLICAYRPEDVALGREGARHPLVPVANELQALFGERPVDLSEADGRAFVDALVDSEPNVLGPAFRQTLFHHTGGHPLFTVDLLRGLQERGELVKDHQGGWAAGAALNWEALPSRVEAVIAERLGRLAPENKALLAAASVQGETFKAEVLARVVGMEAAQVGGRLSGELSRQHRLVRALRRRRFGSQSLSRYCFRHSLYQLYLYQNLDEVERARLHQVTGEALEALSKGHSAEPPIDQASPVNLAWHFEQAGMKEKAIAYLRQAGEWAYLLAANDEAISHYDRARALMRGMPESNEQIRQELLILISLTSALNAARGYAEPELPRLFARAGDLAVKSAEADLVSQIFFQKGSYHCARAEYQETLETGTQLMGLFLDESIPWISDIANFLLGAGRLNMGELVLAGEHFGKIKIGDDSDQVSHSQSLSDRFRLVYPVFLAWVYWLLGYPNKALWLSWRLLTRVRESGNLNIIAFTLGLSTCLIHAFRREFEELQEHAQELIVLSTEKKFTLYQAWGKVFLGRAQVEHGEFQAGLDNLRQGLAEYQATGQKMSLSLLLVMLAEAYGVSGQAERGLQEIERAQAFIEVTGERFAEAEACRVKGELLLQRGEQTVGMDRNEESNLHAEECFRQAVEVAGEQEAKSWQLRAVISLSRLLQQQSREAEAIGLLEDITAWFTDGWDTPDLQEAQVLLDALRR